MFTIFTLFTFRIKGTLEVLSLLILFLRSRLKHSLKLLFYSMLPLHCKHNLCNLSFLINFYLYFFFRFNFFHFKLSLFIFLSQLSQALRFIHISCVKSALFIQRYAAYKKFKNSVASIFFYSFFQ